MSPRKIPFVLGFLLPFGMCPVYGQMEAGLNMDSLKGSLSTMKDDTARVQTLIRLGQQYEANQPDSALSYYAAAGALSERLNYPEGTLRYIANYTAVLNLQGKFSESLQLNLKAIEIAAGHLEPRFLMKAYCNTGAVYQNMEHYRQAVDYYLKSLSLVDSLGSSQERSFIYGNLCALYRNLQQPQKALPYGRLAVDYGEKDHDDYAVAMACINLGNALKDVRQLQEGIGYLKRASAIGQSLNDDNIQETALIGLGDAYLTLKAPALYLPAFSQALPLALRLGDVSGKCFIQQGLATGLFNQKQYTAAAALLDSSIGFAQDHDQREPLSRMLLLMSDVQIALGHLQAAEQYRTQYDSVSNVLLNAPLLKNIQELETRYGVEKKQRELLEKDLQLAGKQRWLISTLAGLVLLVLLLAIIYYVYRHRQRLAQKTIETLHAQQETMRVKAILDGEQRERRRISQEMHDDIGSGLTRLLFLSRSQGTDTGLASKINAVTADLIRKMNEVIWMMNNERDTLESLVAQLRAAIGEMLEPAGIRLEFAADQIPEEMILPQELRRNIYLTVKEAVHNAVKHAAATVIAVSVQIGPALTITVRDNGRGFDPAASGSSGNGLANMRSRMQTIGGHMEISHEGGTRLVFSVPLP